MKKIAFCLVLVLLTGLFAGCAGTPVVYYTNCTCPVAESGETAVPAAPAAPADTTPEVKPTEAEKVDVPVADGELKTGLAVVCSTGKSVSATADAAGAAEFDVTVVAVLVDENGVIVDCLLDSIGTSVKFDAKGQLTEVPEGIKTKNELGPDYNMKTYGGAIAEWDQQAAAVAAYAVGKTADELMNGAVNESGYAADADLASSATIYIGGYVNAIVKAVETAEYRDAQGADKLVFAAMPKAASSASATAEKAGTAQLDVDVVAMTLNGETITSCVIDSLQGKVSFDTNGAITTDLTAPVQTKNELGENYNMKTYGGAIAEWDVQTASFCQYVTGKTVAEVGGIAVDAGTKPTGEDLNTSVTIAIGGFQALIAKAAQ